MVRTSLLCLLTVLATSSCSDSRDHEVLPIAQEPSGLKLEYHSQYQEHRNISEIIAETSLVVIGHAGRADKIEALSDDRNLNNIQAFTIEEILLGDVTGPEIQLALSGANIDNSEVQAIFEQGGELILPIGGFGSLLRDERYLLFLTPTTPNDAIPPSAFTVTGSLAQGAFFIADDFGTRRFGLEDILDPSGNLVMSTEFLAIRFEDVPVLTDYVEPVNLAKLKALVAAK